MNGDSQYDHPTWDEFDELTDLKDGRDRESWKKAVARKIMFNHMAELTSEDNGKDYKVDAWKNEYAADLIGSHIVPVVNSIILNH